MVKITFKTDLCKGCGLCVEFCPKKIVAIRNDVINKNGHHPAGVTDQSACIGCASCATMCPDCAIEIEKE